VPPWANFVEILDEEGLPVPAGEEGNIVVTCLTIMHAARSLLDWRPRRPGAGLVSIEAAWARKF